MRAVLYTHDLEPITVLELKPWAWDFLERTGIVRLHVPMPPANTPWSGPPVMEPLRIVTIQAERLCRGSQEHLMLFTRDEESALLLESAFLPGQHRRVQDRERMAFAQGFLHALDLLGS